MLMDNPYIKNIIDGLLNNPSIESSEKEDQENKNCSIKIKDIIEIENNEDYIPTLEKNLDSYKEEFNTPYFEQYNEKYNLIKEVEINCNSVLEIAKLLIEAFECGKKECHNKAKEKMKKLLVKYIDNDFIFGDINNSYAFRGSGNNKMLCEDENLYNTMKNSEIFFYRSRADKNKENFNKFSEITSLPFSKKEFSANGRFSKNGIPCLYLSLTSYACFLEVGNENNFEELYTSAFRFNNEGLKKITVLNLAIYKNLLDGLKTYSKDRKVIKYFDELRNSLFKIAPIHIASSFVVTNKNYDKRYDYLIPQCIIESLSELGDEKNIYGVAYLSNKKIGRSNYPYCVNLAIPINDLGDNEEFGELYNYIDMTGPILNKDAIDSYKYDENKTKTHIEKIFFDEDSSSDCIQRLYDIDSTESVNYKDTDYHKVDYHLANMNMFNATEKLKAEK